MMIHKDKCQEIGLPESKSYESQQNYIFRAMLCGTKLNTRICRYIGIHNLHSIVSGMNRKKYTFTLEHGRVRCPCTGETPPLPVDIVRMARQQRQSHEKLKSLNLI